MIMVPPLVVMVDDCKRTSLVEAMVTLPAAEVIVTFPIFAVLPIVRFLAGVRLELNVIVPP